MVFGILIVWSSLGYATKGNSITLSLGKVNSETPQYWFLETCAALLDVVYLEWKKCKMLWWLWAVLSKIKSFFLHILLVRSVALSHFSCFSLLVFLVLLDYYNFGSWFLPPQYIPNVLELATFLIKFFVIYQKKIYIFFELSLLSYITKESHDLSQ